VLRFHGVQKLMHECDEAESVLTADVVTDPAIAKLLSGLSMAKEQCKTALASMSTRSAEVCAGMMLCRQPRVYLRLPQEYTRCLHTHTHAHTHDKAHSCMQACLHTTTW
jgi:hypothetical protein